MRILVVGSYNVGLVMAASRLPSQGETLLATDFFSCPGGKGSNQAIGAARLGASTAFVACVGTDSYGDDALALLQREGVDTQYVRRAPTHTGVGFVIVGPQGDNSILVAPGANHYLLPETIGPAIDELEADVLLLQCEIPVETVVEAARLGKARGMTVILNPAPAIPHIEKALPYVDVLTPNEVEARTLLGLEEESGDSVAALSKRLLGCGCRAVVMTQGAKGALVVTDEGVFEVPSFSVTPVDTTGAGDAFNAALAVGLGRGLTLEESARRACGAGALAVMKPGVVEALPFAAELDSLIQNAGR